MSLDSLIVCVAANALQYYEFVTTEQFYGVTSGSNTVASNCFTVPLKMTGSRPDQLKETIRGMYSTLGELIGFLARNDPTVMYARLNLQFLRYAQCMGMDNGSYMMRMGKYKPGAIYAPLSKYFAMDEGVGPRPFASEPVLPTFTSPDVPEEGVFASLAIDGDGVILVARGDPVEVEVPPELNGHVLAYKKVSRATIDEIPSTEDGIADLTMEISGFNSFIPRCGLLDFTRGTIQLGGFAGTKVLKFSGVFYAMADEDMWLGNYGENMFDGNVYIAAVSELRVRGGAQNHMSRVNQIWSRCIRNCRDLQPGPQNGLLGFVGHAIFSNGCMEVIRQDASYLPGRAGSGKAHLSRVLSLLYAIYAIMVVSEYLCM